MKRVAMVLMGCGGVGRQLLQHIIYCRSLHAKLGVHLAVVGVCDSKSLLVASDVLTKELDDTFLDKVCKAKEKVSSLLTLSSSGQFEGFSFPEARTKIIEISASLGKSKGLAFVDCSASSETVELLIQVVDSGCCVVMANKKPLASSLEGYEKMLSNPRRIRYESTVGAGLPVIASLNRLLSSGDEVHHIVGSLSGTLGYVMSEVEDGKPLSEVVKSAKILGYTEPDPRDDLGGMDVARKALILARLLGRRIELDCIKVESLYPEAMGPDKMTVEDFLENGLLLLDKGIQGRVDNASSKGNVLRYVCVINQSRCEVGIQEVSKSSALGRLRGSDNVLEISSRCYSQQPLVIQGAGAGNDTTAAGVLAEKTNCIQASHKTMIEGGMANRAQIPTRNSALIGMIADEDTITGFLLAGAGIVDFRRKTNYLIVDSKTTMKQIEDAFKEFTSREDIAIVLINQYVANMMRFLVDNYNKPIPAILEIPSKDHPYDPTRDSVLPRMKKYLFSAESVASGRR